MDYQTLGLEERENILTITFNRPQHLNTFNSQLPIELLDALLNADRQETIRVVIITGAGSAFCAGIDIPEALEITERKGPFLSSFDHMIPSQGSVSWIPLVIRQMKKPVIAAINGPAIGAGFSVALACDLRIASMNAKMGAPFARVGLSPEFGSSYNLPRLVGIAKACELVFTGDIIDAMQMKEIGLVNDVVSPEELSTAAYKLAKKICQSPQAAIQLAKRALYRGMDTDYANQVQFETLAIGMLARTEDHLEALRAFAEKRKPIFKDK